MERRFRRAGRPRAADADGGVQLRNPDAGPVAIAQPVLVQLKIARDDSGRT